MMPESDNPWFRFGHALERTLQTLSSPGGALSGLRGEREVEEGRPLSRARPRRAERTGGDGTDIGGSNGSVQASGASAARGKGEEAVSRGRSGKGRTQRVTDRAREALERLPMEDEDLARVVDALVAAGGGTLLSRLLRGRRSPGVGTLIRAGAAGAVAAVLLEVLRPLLDEDADGVAFDRELGFAVTDGIGRGLVYGALVHRRIPGPPLLRGATFGAAEYLVGPWGGLSRLLHPLSPHSSLPLVGALLEPADSSADTLVEHLVFGTSLGLLYGTTDGDDGDD